MAENTPIWVILLIGAFLLGGSVMYAIAPVKTVVNEVPVRDVVEKIVEVPGENIIITETVADASLFLEQAINDVKAELEDDDDFLTCGGHEFDEDEVSVQRVKEWSYTWLDDDEFEVWFKAKYKFDDDSDERDCKETREFTVFYEEGEDPVVK